MSLDLFAWAKERRDTGMATAAGHSPRFSDAAFAAIERVAKRQLHVHVDDVLPECGMEPNHPNAWGAAWGKAIRAGIIQRSKETRPCKTDPKKHAHQYPVYFSLIYAP